MNARSADARPGAVAVALRVVTALLGGYAFSWGFVTLGISALARLGMGYDDAWMLVMMLAFLVYLAAVLWAFSARSLVRTGTVLVAGGAVMTFAATLLGA